MSKLEDMKSKFLSVISEDNINYDWDSGWCYSYISHPVMEEAEENLSDDDYELFTQFTDTWLSENDGPLFHMSDVVDGKLVNQLGTWDEEMEKFEQITAKQYAQGLIDLIKRDPTGYKDEEKIAELQAFINS